MGCQELVSRSVVFLLVRQSVFKTVQFHGQPSHGTIEVEKVPAERVLAPELNPAKRPARNACQSWASSRVGLRRSRRALPVGFTEWSVGAHREKTVLGQCSSQPPRRWEKGPPLPNPEEERRKQSRVARFRKVQVGCSEGWRGRAARAGYVRHLLSHRQTSPGKVVTPGAGRCSIISS
jgi:hypothetical protein